MNYWLWLVLVLLALLPSAYLAAVSGGVTQHVVRIESALIRVPLWSLWYPVALLDNAVSVIAAGAWRRIFTRDYWTLAGAVYVLGIEGIKD